MPADEKLSIDTPTGASVPPAVRVITARGQAVQLVIAQFAELVAMPVLTYALCMGHLSEQTFGYLFAACLSGRFAQQVGSAIRGKPVPPPATNVVTMTAMIVVTAMALFSLV